MCVTVVEMQISDEGTLLQRKKHSYRHRDTENIYAKFSGKNCKFKLPSRVVYGVFLCLCMVKDL